jgi:hypothetical protein
VKSSPANEVDSDMDDDEATVAFEDLTPTKGQPFRPTAASRPSRRQCSFITALVQNARNSRSKSRSRARSRSKSCTRGAKSRSKSRGQKVAQRKECESELPCEMNKAEHVVETNAVSEHRPNIVIDPNQRSCQEEMRNPELVIPARKEQAPPKPEPEYIRLCPKYDFPPPPPGVRGPIFHPDYQLGDHAQEQDMIVFPTCKSRKGRHRRRRRHDDDEEDSDEESHDRSARVKVIVESAINQLCHLDAAFVRRSDGSWTYAIMADRTDDAIRFVVNDKGSTKSYPKHLWKSSVRRIRVLTQRQGDRFLRKDGGTSNNAGRRRRSIGRSRSKGKGRLTSPSPTRRNTGVLNIPPTIMEHQRHHGRR